MAKDVAALCAALAADPAFAGFPTRNIVVGLVENGQIVPNEAEAWARDAGEAPFAGEPVLAKFDPMAEPDWTLAMAMAWVAWRTPNAVRRVWAAFLQECTSWERYEATLPSKSRSGEMVHVVGCRLVQPDLKAPDDVLMSAKTWTAMAKASPSLCLDPPEIDPDRAGRELRAALRAGDPLVARHGIMAEVVDRHVWGALSPFDSGRGGPEDVHDPGGVVQFHRVRVERDAVLAVWPVLPRTWIGSALENAAAALAWPVVEAMAGGGAPPTVGRGKQARAAKADHAQRRVAFLRERVPDLSKKGAMVAARRHSDEFQRLHGKDPVGRSQHGKDLKALRQPQEG